MPRKALNIIITLLLPILILIGASRLLANIGQRAILTEGIVHIAARICQGDKGAFCTTTGTASGVFIDSRGIILTSHEIVSGTQGQPSVYRVTLNNDNSRIYRAELLAVSPEKGLALLLIYYSDDEQMVINKDLLSADSRIKFPVLQFSEQPLKNVSEVQVAWLPTDIAPLARFTVTASVDDAMITLPVTLAYGMHGAPVLWQDQIVGIVISANGANEIRVRSITEMNGLLSQTDRPLVWLEDAQVISQTVAETTYVEITAKIHTLDQVSKRLAFLAYVFDENGRPVINQSVGENQVAFHRTYSPLRFADVYSVVLTASLEGLELNPENLRFRFLVWDVENERVMWRNSDWYRITVPPNPTATEPPTHPPSPTSPTLDCPDGMAPVIGQFCLDLHEVTNAEYADCQSCSPPYDVNTRHYQPYYGNPTYTNYPVVAVTWVQAEEYCTKLGKSLPTAEQWEQTAATVVNRLSVEKQVRIFTDTMNVTVNMQDRSIDGIYDLIGNVREWASDNSQAVASKKNVVGLSYQDDKSPPDSELPDQYRSDLGFRCAKKQ